MITRTGEQAAGPPSVVLDLRVLKPFEIGARLDALLCYPTASFEKQQAVADAICASLVAHSIADDPSRKADLWRRFPRYKKSASRASLATLQDRRDDALTAGLAFLPLLKKAAIGELPILRGRQKELSLREIAQFLWPPRGHGTEVNYESRLNDRTKHGLRKYYRVAHLAAAFQYIAHERSGTDAAAPFDYQDIDLYREVVRRANEYAGYFAAIPRLGNIADALIHIEWRE